MTRVTLFIPCFVDQLTPQIGVDTARVLRRLGYALDFPEQQTCCGQPAFNSGYWEDARPVAERFVRIFGKAEVVVCPSASCSTMVRNFYAQLLAGRTMCEEAVQLGKRVFEFSEFLVKVAGVTDLGAYFPYRVTYHDSCHALRELHLQQEPRQLLSQVRGLKIVEMADSEDCCGFGGTFAVKFPMISAAMGAEKTENILASGAEYVVSIDPSCLLHIDGILRRRRSPVRAIHLSQVLACRPEERLAEKEENL